MWRLIFDRKFRKNCSYDEILWSSTVDDATRRVRKSGAFYPECAVVCERLTMKVDQFYEMQIRLRTNFCSESARGGCERSFGRNASRGQPKKAHRYSQASGGREVRLRCSSESSQIRTGIRVMRLIASSLICWKGPSVARWSKSATSIMSSWIAPPPSPVCEQVCVDFSFASGD